MRYTEIVRKYETQIEWSNREFIHLGTESIIACRPSSIYLLFPAAVLRAYPLYSEKPALSGTIRGNIMSLKRSVYQHSDTQVRCYGGVRPAFKRVFAMRVGHLPWIGWQIYPPLRRVTKAFMYERAWKKGSQKMCNGSFTIVFNTVIGDTCLIGNHGNRFQYRCFVLVRPNNLQSRRSGTRLMYKSYAYRRRIASERLESS